MKNKHKTQYDQLRSNIRLAEHNSDDRALYEHLLGVLERNRGTWPDVIYPPGWDEENNCSYDDPRSYQLTIIGPPELIK